ncbi:MAG: hypothetical protein JWO36_242 [Myxococcales bacterium]|nr:hypothetical protein [Myxococcales bacterium]
MASYAFLDSLDPIDRVLSAGTPELEAKLYVPLFWLALFEAGDLRAEPLSGVKYGDRDGLFAIEPPYLVTDSASAIARFKRRTPALAALCTETHQPLLKKFSTFVRRLKPSLIVRLSDLDVKAQIRGALELVAQLDKPDASVDEYLVEPLTTVWAKPDWRESEHAESLLSGWGWQVSSEERAQRARERKWQKAVSGRPEGELINYAASRSYAPDELVNHPTLGAGIVVRLVEGSKIEVLFRDGPKTLVHARSTDNPPKQRLTR